MPGFWHRLATLNAPFIASHLRELASKAEQLFPGPPAWATQVIFEHEGVFSMGEITKKDSDAPFPATVTFIDAKGATTTPDTLPSWESDNTTAATVEQSEDGLSAVVTTGLPGAAVISVTTNDQDGNELRSQGTVTVVPGEAVLGEVNFPESA